MAEIPENHPRRASLLARNKLVDAANDGLLAESAMIAHGRGEAFDYLLGERTTESAMKAIKEAASRLLLAKKPVISVNGNTVVLAGKELIRLAAVIGCPIEVNLYYRTTERVSGLLHFLEDLRNEVVIEDAPEGFNGDWRASVDSVILLGEEEDGRIEGLEGPRSVCSAKGIERSDVILVPLEDGDRCEALVSLGKQVIAIDLNPLSRTARKATVTIVDEVQRASKRLVNEAILSDGENSQWNNEKILREALDTMGSAVGRI
ncbi:MAG TPA: phosphopantothenate/pantothenate synthetase [Candidatus Thalassarchaeaceae archaeon]|nr:phosphopantothenate/pantothenate synthetase [Candidatus Thalassarchaeaceae archaeon]